MRPLWPALSERGSCAVEGVIAQHGPVACGSPIWLSGAAVFGTPVWSVSLGLGFGGVGGASPHVWVPQCVAGVSAVLTFSDTLPYCSPYCGALPSTSRVFSPLASSSLSCIGSLSVCLVYLSLLFNVMHLLALSTGDSINGQSSRNRINLFIKFKGGSSVDDDGVAHR